MLSFPANITRSKHFSMKTKTKGLCLLLFLCFFSHQAFTQAPNKPFSQIKIPSYEQSFDSTVYLALYRMIEANRPFTYVTVPRVNSIGNTRTVPLVDGEGAGGFLAEPYIDLNFPLMRGRPGNAHVFQTSHLLIKYGFHTRVAQDSSSPILPPTNRFGLEFNKVLWDNTSQVSAFSFRRSSNKNWFDNIDKDLKMLYFIFEAQHYSNGQSSGVFKDSTLFVNDYRDGDFSTNFLKFNLAYAKLDWKNCSLINMSLMYRFDFGADEGFLKFLPEQNRRYGKHRIGALIQWRSAPFEIFKWFNDGLPKALRWLTLGRFWQKSPDDDKAYVVKSLYTVALRWESEYILGNLDDFRLENKYRFGNHLYFELSPMRTRSIAFLAHAYLGRDYLNIRYDDIVFTLQFGITASLNKYFPIGFKSGNSIVRPAVE